VSQRIRRLFWDIETSPNIVFSWRCGSKIFVSHDSIIRERAIICICYKWEDKKKVHALTWDDGDDRRLVQEFAAVMEEADEMVAHNGDHFDLRWFNARNLIHDLPPIPKAKTIDTLKIAQSQFYMNSNRLDYLGKILLGEGKIQTDFDLWQRIVLHDDEKALNEMVRYCKKDVELLERVWGKLRDYAPVKTHAAVLATGDPKNRWMCPYCASGRVKKSKTRATATGMVQHQMHCRACGRYYTVADKVFTYYLKEKLAESLLEKTGALA
jgi:hypothetical protein